MGPVSIGVDETPMEILHLVCDVAGNPEDRFSRDEAHT